MSNSCPQPDVLRRYMNGKTSGTHTEFVENHLADCSRCKAYLEVISEESDSLLQLVAEAVAAPVFALGMSGGLQPASNSLDSRRQYSSSESVRSGEREPARMIRDYRLMECIGEGGMGSVYRALHVRMDRQVALKILKSDRMESPEAISRFAREMRLLAQLEHPHIVRALDAGEQDGLPYFVMEFVSGINLNQLVKRLGPLPVPEACSIVRLAAGALQYAHEQKVLHRDVKPSNLMITGEGNVKLLDLGLAQFFELKVEDSISRTDQALGTLAYMPPEQFSGRHQVTRQSDIFSLGVTLHELLTGQHPFVRPGLPPLVSDIRKIRPDVDENLIALVSDMIALTPSERPPSMADVESRLNTIAPPTNLSVLVAEYYRWNTNSWPSAKSEFPKADTGVGSSPSTDRQFGSTPSGLASPPIALPAKGFWKNQSAAQWLQGLALVSSLSAMSWMAFWREPRSGPMPKNEQPLLVPDSTIELKVKVEVSVVGTVASQLLEDRDIALENVDTGHPFVVTEGPLELPIGKYRLHYTAPVEIEEDGKDFEVFATSTNPLKLSATLKNNFQYPAIPNWPASAIYHGSIWRKGWKVEDQRQPFELCIEVLAVNAEPNIPVTKWLKIEIYDSRHNYRETAYLNIDAKTWEDKHQLDIHDGWIVASSSEIKRYMTERWQNTYGGRLIVPFDREQDLQDLLSKLTSASNLLPEQRLSVQDVISLFFGEQMPAADESVRSARAQLSKGGRNDWLQPIHDGYGQMPCYVVSSRNQHDDTSKLGYMLAQRKSSRFIPFGFVKLEVNTTLLVADCVLRDGGDSIPVNLNRTLEELRRNEFPRGKVDAPDIANSQRAAPSPLANPTTINVGIDDIVKKALKLPSTLAPAVEAIPSSTKRFDLAPIPRERSWQRFLGKISLDKEHSETIDATIRMLGEEKIDGLLYRWIELEITSRKNGQDHWEAARMLIDSAAYDDSSNFVIKQGWIAYGNKKNVFAIPSDGNLESLIDDRLQLQNTLQLDRIGVVDALSMLFNANLKPRTNISSLRAEISGILAGTNRTAKQETFLDKYNKKLDCERWKPKNPLPQVLDYSILRSSEVPFGFVSVTLDVGGLHISLEMDNHGSLRPQDFSSSFFGTKNELNELERSNISRLQSHPTNWRVWTWKHAGKTYKAWAEFGGTIDSQTGSDVLLRDKAGQEIRVPKTLLSPDDIKYVNDGRIWSKSTFPKNLQRVLVKDDEKTQKLEFEIPGNPPTTTSHVGDPIDKADQEWLRKLRDAKKRNLAVATNAKDSEAFAQYMR